MLKGKVFVTGGAGFLGRGLLRKAEKENWPCEFTVYSRDETKQVEARKRWPDVRYILGDVRDYDRLEVAVAGHDIIIHGAALKYVPESEFNVAEAIVVNIGGTENTVRAAVRMGIPKVIGISTDKACRPVNVYGATKMLMERLFAEACDWGSTSFMCVRYGNVVGSTGSVIPLFQQQLAQSGQVKLTDPNMTRFWLSVDEAIDLIVFVAASYDEESCGSVIIPRCGAMKMGDLARTIAGEVVEIVGPRPGEKQHEELVHFQESGRAKNFGPYIELRPATEPGEGEQWTYASHDPSRWITQDEMRGFIEEAEGL